MTTVIVIRSPGKAGNYTMPWHVEYKDKDD